MRVALLGFGKSGQALFEELTSNDLVDVISVFDPNPAVKSKFSSKSTSKVNYVEGVFSFLQPVDLVVITSPDHYHAFDLMRCIEFGIPTFVEKPYVSSKAELESLEIALVQNPKYQTTCNLVLRSSPLFRAVKTEFLRGTFGSRVFIEGKYLYGRWSKLLNGWRGHDNYSVILGGLIHLVDLACFITGNFNHKVSINSHRITSKEPLAIKDFAQVSMSSELSGFCSLTTDFSAEVEHRRDISIFGDLARLEVKGHNIDVTPGPLDYLADFSPAPSHKGALLSEFISNLTGLHSKTQTYPTVEEVLKVLNICLGNSTDNIS